MAAFGLLNEPKNIIELFTFDLTTFFVEDDYEEISCIEEAGVFMIEYEKMLPWIEHGLFNSVIFRVFNDKKNIIGSNHINVRFTSNIDSENMLNLQKLVYKLQKIYGFDDENLGDWTTSDEESLKSGKLLRQWTLGEGKHIYTVKLRVHKSELTLEILFFNHLLELLK